MRQSFSVLVCVLLATAAYAQDVDFGAFGDPGTLLGPGSPAPAAARGAAPARGATVAPPPDRLVRLRDILSKAEAPLTKEQESELNKLLDAEIPAMQRTIQTHGREMMAAKAESAPTPRATATPPGAPAAPPSSRVPPEILDALEVEWRQLNDALFTRVASSPTLNAKQQSILTKMSRDQIRSRGGFEALRIAMEDAGAPFTAEQVPKVQALFGDQKTARATLARESQGTPDPAALKQLERDTLTKVVGLLVPAQRTALLAFLRAQQ